MENKIKLIFRYILLIIYGIFLFKYSKDRDFLWLIDNFNLIIHEGGHVFFNFFGDSIAVAGGTLFQVVIPTITGFMFYKQKDYFSISFSLFWLGTNMFNIARYVADAPYQVLQLVSMGSGDPIHDWNYMLSNAGALNSANIIANCIYSFGYIFLVSSIIFGGFITIKDFRNSFK